MPTYVKTDYVPVHSKGYITVGREYLVISEGMFGGVVIDDEGDEMNIFYDDSSHLDNRAWIVINRP